MAQTQCITHLTEEAGISRSVLAERFRHYVNEPPMAYLTRWRLQVGAQMMLASTSYLEAQIAAEVGYESEAAFNRAFKREFDGSSRTFPQSSDDQSKVIKTLEDSVNCGDAPGRQIGTACG